MGCTSSQNSQNKNNKICKLFSYPVPIFLFLCRVQQPHEPSYENNSSTNINLKTWEGGNLELGVLYSVTRVGKVAGWKQNADIIFYHLSSRIQSSINLCRAEQERDIERRERICKRRRKERARLLNKI